MCTIICISITVARLLLQGSAASDLKGGGSSSECIGKNENWFKFVESINQSIKKKL